MPIKWVLHWQPNAGATASGQIVNEVTQCVESLNGVKDGRWKATLTFYRPILRDQALLAEFPRDFLGISLLEQPNKYYFIIRGQRLVVEADSSMQTIMETLQSYKLRVSLNFEGFLYQVGEFKLRVGKVSPTHSETLRGIVMEVEYLPISSVEKSRQMMDDFLDLWHETLSKRSLPGHFVHIEPNFAEFGLGDHYTSQHTAVQYATVVAQMDPSILKKETDPQRKRKFVPKAPPRRDPKTEIKNEVAEDADGEQARDLLKRFNEGLTRAKPKVVKKVAATQIAFGYGGASTTIKSYGVHKAESSRNYQGPPSTGAPFGSRSQEEKEYKEPWDYYAYYPTTLPLRRPYSGNPELLDEEEFGAAPETISNNETLEKSANELDLMEENSEVKMLFLQLPSILPLTKRSATADQQEVADGSLGSRITLTAPKSCALNELSEGLMGKMLVYRSGAIKLRIGDTLFDVSSGMDCGFAQDVVAINTTEKQCCIVGELNKRAIVTPDLDHILQSMEDE